MTLTKIDLAYHMPKARAQRHADKLHAIVNEIKAMRETWNKHEIKLITASAARLTDILGVHLHYSNYQSGGRLSGSIDHSEVLELQYPRTERGAGSMVKRFEKAVSQLLNNDLPRLKLEAYKTTEMNFLLTVMQGYEVEAGNGNMLIANRFALQQIATSVNKRGNLTIAEMHQTATAVLACERNPRSRRMLQKHNIARELNFLTHDEETPKYTIYENKIMIDQDVPASVASIMESGGIAQKRAVIDIPLIERLGLKMTRISATSIDGKMRILISTDALDESKMHLLDIDAEKEEMQKRGPV